MYHNYIILFYNHQMTIFFPLANKESNLQMYTNKKK